jgi:hypothetical protein
MKTVVPAVRYQFPMGLGKRRHEGVTPPRGRAGSDVDRVRAGAGAAGDDDGVAYDWTWRATAVGRTAARFRGSDRSKVTGHPLQFSLKCSWGAG